MRIAKEVYLLFNILSSLCILASWVTLFIKVFLLSFLSKNMNSPPSSSRIWFLVHFELNLLYLFPTLT